MYNGNHHEVEAGATTKPDPEVKPDIKPPVIQKPEPKDKAEPLKK
jgi:hypothetical protein